MKNIVIFKADRAENIETAKRVVSQGCKVLLHSAVCTQELTALSQNQLVQVRFGDPHSLTQMAEKVI